jgi:alpha-L-fucosidase
LTNQSGAKYFLSQRFQVALKFRVSPKFFHNYVRMATFVRLIPQNEFPMQLPNYLSACIRTTCLFLALIAIQPASVTAQTYTPDWSSLDKRATPDWWLDAKFGIFIHWGVYAVPAYTTVGNYAEWYQNSLTDNLHEGKIQAFHQANFGNRTYYDLADDFHAELFNPDEWARLFEKAGARYVVLTSKHHDGFCLWPSKEAGKTWGFPWSADVRGPNRDLVGDLFGALQKTKVKPGLYYSLYEWYNPLWKFDHARYASDHAIPQLVDLVSRYQPWVVWADGDWDASPETWQSPKFLSWLYNESPVRDRVVVNDRWGSGVRFKHAGIYTPEYQPDLDFEDHAWEESRGMGFSYGYNRAEDASDYNSTQSLVLQLVDKVSRGGNFLLDIGPDAHGKIPPIMQERLLEIGNWLDVNGEAIYGTRRWRTSSQWSAGNRDYKPAAVEGKPALDLLLKQTVDPEPGYAVKEVFYTWNPQTKSVYAILPKYPDSKKIVLKGIGLQPGTEVTFLATKEKLKWENAVTAKTHLEDRPGDDYRSPKPAFGLDGQELTIYLPDFNPNKIKSTEAYVIKIANFGAFSAKPKIEINYDPKTIQPWVSMSGGTMGSTIRYTLDGSEPRESSPEYRDPFSPKAACTIKAKAFRVGLIESNIVQEDLKLYTMLPALSMFREPDAGIKAEVIKPKGGKFTSENILSGTVEKTADVFNFNPDPACLSDKCAMIWKGYIRVAQTGGYRFWLESDDGSLLNIGTQQVVNNDGDHGSVEKSGIAFMQQGWHQIRLVYFNSGGPGNLNLSFAPLGGEKQPITKEMLAH